MALVLAPESRLVTRVFVKITRNYQTALPELICINMRLDWHGRVGMALTGK